MKTEAMYAKFCLPPILLLMSLLPATTYGIVSSGGGAKLPSGKYNEWPYVNFKSPPTLIDEGLLDMEVTGTGTTTSLVFNLTNKTDEHLGMIIPTGTLVTTASEGYQPYQTGCIPPIVLEPGETLTREFPAYCTDNELEPAPAEESVKYTPQTDPLTEQQKEITELIITANAVEDLYTTCGSVAEPDDFVSEGLLQKPYAMSTIWHPTFVRDSVLGGVIREEPYDPYYLLRWLYGFEEGWSLYSVPPFSPLGFMLDGALAFPGTLTFGLEKELPELKFSLSYVEKDKEETNEMVVAKPRGNVEVSVETTDDPEIVRFNISKLSAYSPSVTFRGVNRGDVMLTPNSPEKNNGTLNINTGEVRGTASLKAFGEEFDEPFPVAVAYNGHLDFATKVLNLEASGISFEPVKLEKEGLYQKMRPEKFWDAVHLYTIWDETNDVGKKELRKVMTEQLKTEFPEGRAEELADMVTTEIMDKVEEVKDLHKELKEEKFDFSRLDPTLKWRKT